ncbi:SKI family transcriptional corepressor 2 [Varanus komodoensis]|uniref:SKI family transcriptional corepressor 2 n=1 Tax=Varanus komodoensis TaxID=61221 RepID=UPI001CF7DE4E|nr:SKI family transcriptional corepressor 2 [Varanus komodoensis]
MTEGAGARGPAAHQPHLLEGPPRGKGASSYHHSSAFRPVGGKEDSESLAKLHHHHQPPRAAASPPPPPPLLLAPERDPGGGERAGHRLLSPGGTSCSYPSEDSSEEEDEDEEDEEEEPEVDVESHRPPGEEEDEEEDEDAEDAEAERAGAEAVDPVGAPSRYLQSRGLTDKGAARDRSSGGGGGGAALAPPAGPFPAASCRPSPEEEKTAPPGAEHLLPPAPALPACPPKAGSSGTSSPAQHLAEEEPPPPYKDVQKSKEGTQAVVSAKENKFSDKSKEQTFFITDSEPPGGDFWRNITGEPIQQANPPHSLKKDVENMGKEELQKVLFEQIDLRRRLEQEFQVLKGTASFPVFNNFQDQMKRELAYREEMVQQLQIIPYAASLIRKEKLGTHLSKS